MGLRAFEENKLKKEGKDRRHPFSGEMIFSSEYCESENLKNNSLKNITQFKD